MKTKILVTIMMLFSFSLVAGVYAQPKATYSESEYDFGIVPQHAKISHTFIISSTGSDSLKIVKVIPGCGCTKAPLEKAELAVGESTKLEIIFDTKSYTNTVRKTPKIMTNEGFPEKRFLFSATVVADPSTTTPVIIKPYKLDLSMLASTGKKSFAFKIENVSDKPVTLSVIDMPKNLFTVELPKSIDPGKTAEGKLTLTDPENVDKMEKSFTFETDDGSVARFTVPVYRTGGVMGQK